MIPSFPKQPDEIIPVAMDYASTLQDEETITAVSVTIADAEGDDVTSDILISVVAVDGVVKFAVQGGESGKKYHITIMAETNQGSKYEEDIIMITKEI